VGVLFWQQSLGESVDVLISPAPIHKHHGGMIQSCYSKPVGLYDRLRTSVGRDFNLMHYWGPLASAKSSDWIASATAALLQDKDAPDLCFTYLPVLDYDLQRFGPDSEKAKKALAALQGELTEILISARENNYDVLVFGDYAIRSAGEGAVLPNLALKNKGFLQCRNIKGALYPDLYASSAFAVVDHEIAHVYVKNRDQIVEVRDVLRHLQGVGDVLDGEGQIKEGVAHTRSGELVLVADDGYWFAYPWWNDKKQAPDYAGHVDIHNKPGYDPCELFFGWPPMSVSQNTDKIKGTHGRTGDKRLSCWASTCSFETEPSSLLELALTVRSYLENMND
jgi:predicted AlkP superfamily pyrophosphatase or phosphodiesterase